MDLYEHQARGLFEEHGILVPRAEVTDSPEEAAELARGLGDRVVVKAQVRTGGRGKAGGVRPAGDPAAAELVTRQILGMDIKGHTVGKVMEVTAAAMGLNYVKLDGEVGIIGVGNTPARDSLVLALLEADRDGAHG